MEDERVGINVDTGISLGTLYVCPRGHWTRIEGPPPYAAGISCPARARFLFRCGRAAKRVPAEQEAAPPPDLI